MKRGRGRPPGAKNKKKLEQEAAEAAEEKRREAKLREKREAHMAQRSIVDESSNPRETFSQNPNGMAQMRLLLDQKYMDKWQEGKRMRKKPDQMGILMNYFDKNPNWTYAIKMEIAAQIGMTPNQVSKWNWDQRKKLNMSTERKKGPKT